MTHAKMFGLVNLFLEIKNQYCWDKIWCAHIL